MVMKCSSYFGSMVGEENYINACQIDTPVVLLPVIVRASREIAPEAIPIYA
jgi:hypothetical protein